MSFDTFPLSAILKVDNHKDLVDSIGNPAQCPGWERSVGRMDPWVWMAESHLCSPGMITTLLISYTPIQIKSLLKKIKGNVKGLKIET